MSGECKDGGNVDAELSNLLDSALEDFGKSPQTAKPTPSTAFAHDSDDDDPPMDSLPTSSLQPADDLGEGVSSDMIQKAARDFSSIIKQMQQVQEAALAKEAAGEQPETAALSPEEEQFDMDFMRNLQALASQAERVGAAQDPEEMNKAMSSMMEGGENSEFSEQFMPFMTGLMSHLVSKEVMHPSLLEILEKFDPWMETNKDTISPDDHQRYTQQISVMQSICKEFDEEKEEDTDEMRSARFTRVMVQLQQLQSLGQPPTEVVGDVPPGWAFDPATSMPQVTDPSAAADSCSLM